MKKFLALLLVVSLLLLTGCGMNKEKKGDDTVVAVSFYPVYIFTLNLVDGIDGVEVRCMTEQNTGCLHDYTLTARDARLLNDADVFVVNGAGMETFLPDLCETVENLPVIDSSYGVELICNDSHDHEEHEGHSHNHQTNSHIWLSVKNAKKQVVNIKNGLIKNLPQFEKQITENCDKYLKRLNTLSEEISLMGDCADNLKIITFHGAYEYMAEDMGFDIIATVESDEGGEPSAKRMVHLCNEIKEQGVKALFIEPNYNGSAAQVISGETGVEIYVLNPVISGENKLTAYEDIMLQNFETIKKAVR